MATIKLNYKSETLKKTVELFCYLPTDTKNFKEVKGVVTLLHGIYGNCNDWQIYSSACLYAAENSLALVCPNAENSFYTDMVYGSNYATFMQKELPYIIENILHLPTNREKNMIAGLSMGGYGAFVTALRNPQNYFAAASFSGALAPELALVNPQAQAFKPFFVPVYGENLEFKEEYHLVSLCKKMQQLQPNDKVQLLATCGLQDEEGYHILSQNKYFESEIKKLDVDCKFEYSNGLHEWSFWDRSFALAIDKFFNKGYFETKAAFWK